MKKKVQIKVEYDPRPIRHLAIQCPDCEKWFTPRDIVSNEYPCYDHDLCRFTKCKCPICSCTFDLGDIEEDCNVDFPEFYENCAKKKEIWV